MSTWLELIPRDPPRTMTKNEWKGLHRWLRKCARQITDEIYRLDNFRENLPDEWERACKIQSQRVADKVDEEILGLFDKTDTSGVIE